MMRDFGLTVAIDLLGTSLAEAREQIVAQQGLIAEHEATIAHLRAQLQSRGD